MVVVKTIEEFYQENDQQLRDFMVYKTGIKDQDIINEAIQEFYIRLINSKVLEEFNEDNVKYGSVEKVFETWICNMLCWVLPVMKKKNFRKDGKMVSRVKVNLGDSETEMDILDLIDIQDSNFRISEDFEESRLIPNQTLTKENLIFDDLIKFIKRTEPDKKAQQMISYIEYRREGLLGTDISVILKVSNSTINTLKNNIAKKVAEWRDTCPHL